MNKPDGRSLSEESLELLRRQAQRLRQQGRTQCTELKPHPL